MSFWVVRWPTPTRMRGTRPPQVRPLPRSPGPPVTIESRTRGTGNRPKYAATDFAQVSTQARSASRGTVGRAGPIATSIVPPPAETTPTSEGSMASSEVTRSREASTRTWVPRRRAGGAAVRLDAAAFQERLELARARRVPELAQGLGLDLADALAGDREALAHLLERVLGAVAEPEAHLDDLLLAGGQGLEQGLCLLLQVD